MTELFDYYKLSLKLITEQLGTCTEASIYNEHVLKKAQKLIKEANRLTVKVKKSLEKYKGDEIPEDKQVEELKGIIRRYQEVLGRTEEIPSKMEEVLEYAKELEESLAEALQKGGETHSGTIFMRSKEGKIGISTHMILGNLKENAKIVTNNSLNKEGNIFKSKVSVQECFALDVKPVEDFMLASGDILRNADDTPKLLERPIKFDRMGKVETAIARSEVLPSGTEFTCHLRVRKGSIVTQEVLEQFLGYGKNNGLGQWRGSGHKGAYMYKLDLCDNPTPVDKDGWK